MDNEYSLEQIPQWHDAAASQVQLEPRIGIIKKLGHVAAKMLSIVRNRFEDGIVFNTAMPNRTSTVDEVAEFERNHIDSRSMLGKRAIELTVRPQDPTPAFDAA